MERVMGIVYVLKLEAGRWYCGFTENLERRTAQHFLGRGADWTRIWKPLSLHSAIEGDTELENAQTIALMAQYGWRKVRGGRYTSPALSSQPKVLGSVLGRAVPMKDPKPAFVDELIMGEAKVRFYRSLDGYSATAGGVVFEGSTFGEVLGVVEESLGRITGRDKETETDGLGAPACIEGADDVGADGARA
jgi:predicted GIY-YIG superfamily endonuclease